MKQTTNILKNREDFKDTSNSFFVMCNFDCFVYHFTSISASKKIKENGFKTGFELNIGEKRKAIYFSDKDVNPGIYSRNKVGELYDGESSAFIKINLRGLKLLNINFKNNSDVFINHKMYKNHVVKGELSRIPYEIDGTISLTNDFKIYEVCLSKEITNNIFYEKKNDVFI